MKQMGFYYDPTVCIGCRACQAGCKEEHKLPAGDFFRRVSPVNTEGKWTFFSGACNHCQDPACVAVCPNGALYKDADGTVQHDRTRWAYFYIYIYGSLRIFCFLTQLSFISLLPIYLFTSVL